MKVTPTQNKMTMMWKTKIMSTQRNILKSSTLKKKQNQILMLTQKTPRDRKVTMRKKELTVRMRVVVKKAMRTLIVEIRLLTKKVI